MGCIHRKNLSMGNQVSTERLDETLSASLTETDTANLASQREQELLAFYDRYDPSKKSAVPTLLRDYAFSDVVKSLQRKYKDYPDGWLARSQLMAYLAERVAPAPDLDHVQLLLQRMKPEEVTSALQAKFGGIPHGWGSNKIDRPETDKSAEADPAQTCSACKACSARRHAPTRD